MNHLRLQFSLFALALASLAACDSQVDGEHQGDPLATLDGTVQNQRDQAIASADIVIAWIYDNGEGDSVGSQRVTVEGDFPASFSLAMYEPPEDGVLQVTPDGSHFGIGYIVAAEEGATSVESEASLLGIEAEHMLIYVPETVQAGSEAALFLHSTPEAGFHIYGFRRLTDTELEARSECKAGLSPDATAAELYATCGGDTFDELVPTPGNLETALSVSLVDDIDDLNLANWQ
jgi:hypothetical protein